MTNAVPHPGQRGFLIIAAVFLVVVLGGLAVYLAAVSRTSQAASAADLQAARAYQAARAGIEWAAYQILRDPAGGTFKPACDGGSATRSLTFSSTLADFAATVTCTSTGASLTEDGTPVVSYKIESNGCNVPTGGGACPNAAALSATYVERELRLTLVR